MSYLRSVENPLNVITPITNGLTFPESADAALQLYSEDIAEFRELVLESPSAAYLLEAIRTPKRFNAGTRMSMLKLFRRCVSPVCDTESTKKITKVSTASIVENYGATFKPIATLRSQFEALDQSMLATLAALISENDSRGQSGYELTGLFFHWFESTFRGEFTIEGPRGAGRDVELSTIFPDFSGSYPCDFVIRRHADGSVRAVGFARYDATRGGSQSDDRTGGNANKVDKARTYYNTSGTRFRVLFLADGPGLVHRDTWEEACRLDDDWDGNVRVTTLRLAPIRVTADWLSLQ